MTEQSRAECRHRQRPPFGLLIPFSASTPFHLNEKLECTHAREARVGTEAVGLRFFRPRTTIYSIAITLSTDNAQNAQFGVRLDTVEVPVSAPRAGESKNGGGISAASGLMGRLQATCGARRSTVPCKQLRAFASVCVQLRAFASGFEHARSRLVAFSRVWSRLVAPIFFVFGHARARLGVFFRHFSSFFVILRPKMAFSGMTGNGRLRQRLGREGSSLLRVAPPRRGQDGQNGIAFI